MVLPTENTGEYKTEVRERSEKKGETGVDNERGRLTAIAITCTGDQEKLKE